MQCESSHIHLQTRTVVLAQHSESSLWVLAFLRHWEAGSQCWVGRGLMWRGGAGARRDARRAGRGRVSVGLRWLPGEPVTTKGADGGGCGGLAEFSRALGCARRRRPRLPLAGQYSFGGPGRAGGARCSAAPCRPLVLCAPDPSLGGRGAGGEGGARGRRRVGWGRWRLGRGRGQ